MTDAELDAIGETTYKVSQAAPGLLAWLDYACVWQMQQRAGHKDELRPPESSISHEDIEISIEAAVALRVRFAGSLAACAFFDALARALVASAMRSPLPPFPKHGTG